MQEIFFYKIQQTFMIFEKEALCKQGKEGNFFNLIKGIYEKHAANIILNGERLNTFPLR